MVAYDEHLNLMLEDVKMYRDRKEKEKVEIKNLMYLRGDSVLLVGCK